jgi:hypothetical protein
MPSQARRPLLRKNLPPKLKQRLLHSTLPQRGLSRLDHGHNIGYMASAIVKLLRGSYCPAQQILLGELVCYKF